MLDRLTGILNAPVLVATEAIDADCRAAESVPADRLLAVSRTNASQLAATLQRAE